MTEKINTTPIGDDDYYFRRPYEEGFTGVYYNPDALAGGQFVYMEIPFSIILNAYEFAGGIQQAERFFEYLDERCQTFLVDYGTSEFEAVLQVLKNPKPFCVGRTKKTMKLLVNEAKQWLFSCFEVINVRTGGGIL